jgi:hypothetical protein
MLGVRTTGPMAPDISLERQRPARDVYSQHVAIKLSEIGGRTAPRPAMPASEQAGAGGA